jgi:glyoxylate/hydroxypyruvate reductase A
LMEAIDAGALSGAALDVLEVEPPADDHPFWDHPKITLTPHYACAGRAIYGAQVIIDAIKGMRAGKPLARVVDKSEGY